MTPSLLKTQLLYTWGSADAKMLLAKNDDVSLMMKEGVNNQ